jgi:hypothetical protein
VVVLVAVLVYLLASTGGHHGATVTVSHGGADGTDAFIGSSGGTANSITTSTGAVDTSVPETSLPPAGGRSTPVTAAQQAPELTPKQAEVRHLWNGTVIFATTSPTLPFGASVVVHATVRNLSDQPLRLSDPHEGRFFLDCYDARLVSPTADDGLFFGQAAGAAAVIPGQSSTLSNTITAVVPNGQVRCGISITSVDPAAAAWGSSSNGAGLGLWPVEDSYVVTWPGTDFAAAANVASVWVPEPSTPTTIIMRQGTTAVPRVTSTTAP